MGLKFESVLTSTIDVPGPGQYSPLKKDKTFAFS
jgi:hypothetical protein